MTIGYKHEDDPSKLLELLEKFADLWDGHVVYITIAKHCIEITGNKTSAVCSAASMAGLTVK